MRCPATCRSALANRIIISIIIKLCFNPQPPHSVFERGLRAQGHADNEIAIVQGERHENRECFARIFTSTLLVLAAASPARAAESGVRADRLHYLRRSAGVGMAELELGDGRHGEWR